MDEEAERLLWCLLPDFDIQLSREPRRVSLRDRVGRLIPERRFRFRFTSLYTARGGLVGTRAVTEERVLGSVVGTAERIDLPNPRRGSLDPGRSAALKTAKTWIDATLGSHGRPELRRLWQETANATAYQMQQYTRLDFSRFRFVLVHRQSHPLVRTLIIAAEDQGVPVAFLPHSPMTAWQVDLPFSYAGVRGEAERAFAVDLTGAEPARICVVGNPDVTVLATPMPPLRPESRGILALSPDPEPILRETIELLRSAGCTHVAVAPHPRSDLQMLRRILPPTWRLHERSRTAELLREGPPWVIQRSSGVAWESAALGIPTGDLRSGSRPPDYPFLADENVFPALRDSGDISRFVASASTVDRVRLREYAGVWGSPDGPQAVARAQAFLDGIERSRPRIADAWGPNGVLRSRSELAI